VPIFSDTGGIVKAEGLGDGPTHPKDAIAKLRLTMPPIMLADFAFALSRPWTGLAEWALP
jgi:hypothetical protein